MFNFNEIIERKNTNSLKWDVKENELPMWVADMDFKTAPVVINAIKEKAESGIFGYSIVSEEWKQSIKNWWKDRHNFEINKDWIIFSTGVLPTISCAVKRLTNTGDQVIVQTPVYDMFFNSIVNHGRWAVENELKYDGKSYSIDFKDLEEKLANPITTMMLLCNPQNPSGNIWSKKDLEKIGDLCEKYHVTVISDEIHCDLTEPGLEYIPFASVSEKCAKISLTCISATKAFNIAGLQTSAVVIPSEELFQKMERGLNSDEIAEPNAFAIDAVVAAFNHGGEWLDTLRVYLHESKKMVYRFLEKEIPKIKCIKSQSTYLLWIDCKELTSNTTSFCKFLRKETGLFLSEGEKYRGNGEGFIRLNIACPHSILSEGLRRLKQGVEAYEKIMKEGL